MTGLGEERLILDLSIHLSIPLLASPQESEGTNASLGFLFATNQVFGYISLLVNWLEKCQQKNDTKCYHIIRYTEDSEYLQQDLNRIPQWYKVWQMDFNQSKCGLLTVTRNVKAIPTRYIV